jgi:hypothetical protein
MSESIYFSFCCPGTPLYHRIRHLPAYPCTGQTDSYSCTKIGNYCGVGLRLGALGIPYSCATSDFTSHSPDLLACSLACSECQSCDTGGCGGLRLSVWLACCAICIQSSHSPVGASGKLLDSMCSNWHASACLLLQSSVFPLSSPNRF